MKSATVGRPPTSRNRVLVALGVSKAATATDLESSAAYLDSLVRTGYIRRAGTQKTGEGPGRPAVVFRLTPKGRGRARVLSRTLVSAA